MGAPAEVVSLSPPHTAGPMRVRAQRATSSSRFFAVLQDADHLGRIGFGGQIGQPRLEHHQAERIFEDLTFGISAEILFQIQFVHSHDHVLWVANFAKYLG